MNELDLRCYACKKYLMGDCEGIEEVDSTDILSCYSVPTQEQMIEELEK